MLATLWILMIVSSISITSWTDVFIDMRDALWSWSRSTIDKWDLKDLSKSVVNWDIYEQAHTLAEFQIVQPALDALDMTHQRIASFCWWDIEAKHVTTIFSQLPYWQDLDTMLAARRIVDDVQEYNFEESCVEVVKCYFKDQLEENWVDLAEYNAYTTSTFAACTDVVSRIHTTMLLHTTTKQISKNNNYWDEMFANGTLDDSPYDLLVTIWDIWDLLFTHNEKPSEIKFYDNDPYEFYETSSWDNAISGDTVDVDPDIIEEYPTQDPNDLTELERLPLTSWVTPQIPDWPTNTYTPPQWPPEWWTQWGHDNWINPTWWSIQQNELCEEPVPEQEAETSVLENAEKEREYAYERNEKLDLDTTTAVALWSMFAPEIQQAFGDDSESVAEEVATKAVQDAAAIAWEIWDIWWETLNEFKSHVQWCVEQFTDQTKDKRQKILWKSITQPTAFTKCVYNWMCKEVGDESKLWLYRIKICKQPFRWYNINSNQPVQSIEEIMDELSNVCYWMRESWQLLKHNKTKDHWTNKLMNIKLWDKFSFWLTVWFQAPPAWLQDHAAEKRLAVESNQFLTLLSLWFNEELNYEQEKNKYNLLHDPIAEEYFAEEFDPSIALEKTRWMKISSAIVPWSDDQNARNTDNPVWKRHEIEQQLQHYSELDSLLQQFVQQNTEYWIFAAEHGKSMKETWKATYDKFKWN